jgi:quercetin dioxygenase-like cupin family protein
MSRLPLVLLLLPIIGCSNEQAQPSAPATSTPSRPEFTPGSGVVPTFLGQATFDFEHLQRRFENWRVGINANLGADIAVRSFTYDPGSFTGWHTHPGPVFIQVIKGTVTFYEGDDPNCTPVVVDSGEAYLDLGDVPHIGRNETELTAQDLVVLFGPPGTDPLNFRLDAPAPGNCPF